MDTFITLPMRNIFSNFEDRPPQKAYRHVEPAFAKDLAERGLFKVGAVAAFGNIPGAMADDQDGAGWAKLKYAAVDDAEGPDGDPFRKMGIDIKGKGHTFTNCEFILRPAGHALCLALDPYNETCIQSGKTAVFEIPCVASLAQALISSNSSKLGRSWVMNAVEYDAEPVDALTLTAPLPIRPFAKRKEFSPENEFRLWFPESVGSASHFVQCEAATALMKWINP